jgi:hypothetical protein
MNKDTNTELGNLAEPQLYDLSKDPAETKNVASLHPDRVSEMRKELQAIRQNTYRQNKSPK